MTVASSTAAIASLLTDAGSIVYVVITGVLAIAVGLLGLGYAWRHVQKRVTGRKF